MSISIGFFLISITLVSTVTAYLVIRIVPRRRWVWFFWVIIITTSMMMPARRKSTASIMSIIVSIRRSSSFVFFSIFFIITFRRFTIRAWLTCHVGGAWRMVIVFTTTYTLAFADSFRSRSRTGSWSPRGLSGRCSRTRSFSFRCCLAFFFSLSWFWTCTRGTRRHCTRSRVFWLFFFVSISSRRWTVSSWFWLVFVAFRWRFVFWGFIFWALVYDK